MNSELTDEEADAKVLALIEQGWSLRAIGEQLDIGAMTVSRIADRHGVMRVRQPRIDRVRRRRMAAMIGQGKLSQAAIATELGVSRDTVSREAQRLRGGNQPSQFKKLHKPKRCTSCGVKVTHWPCVACNFKSEGDRNANV